MASGCGCPQVLDQRQEAKRIQAAGVRDLSEKSRPQHGLTFRGVPELRAGLAELLFFGTVKDDLSGSGQVASATRPSLLLEAVA